MIRFFKITTWIVISLSVMFLLFLLFIIFVVNVAMGNEQDVYESGLLILYWITLPATLIMTQFAKYKNKFTTSLAGIMLLIGVVFCAHGIWDSYIKGFWRTQYLLAVIPCMLLLIVFVGLLKKKI
ncbi:MAG TPA: hypothetical protein VK796_05845 [Cytophaga sp.]|nr:hypothetical protein [Cytophaga sp.]